MERNKSPLTIQERMDLVDQVLLQLNVAMTCLAAVVKQSCDTEEVTYLMKCAARANQVASQLLHRERT